ncbi:MAG TPA: hypothetical protein DDX92_13830 [Flavobacteriales bacterium]|jgi:Ca-activated chloride channel family protein|nr:hypothetical protein [Flavobacteriales bacterium]
MKTMNHYLMLFVLMIMSAGLSARQTITGTVTDQISGEALPFVNVLEKGTKNMATTDFDGKYSIEVENNNSVLIFSFVGYENVIIKVENQKSIDVQMAATTELMDVVEIKEYESPLIIRDKTANRLSKSEMKTAGVVYQAYEVGPGVEHNTEEYDVIHENKFHEAQNSPLSTFSIDVDAASYSNIRRVINYGQMPQKDMVRIEEMINYFNYDYPQPTGDDPFSINMEVSQAPWNSKHKLVHIGLQGKNLDYDDLKPSNLVFLIDVSGSMSDHNKLPLLKSSMKMLVGELDENDRVAIVVYAGAAGLVLPSTPVSEKEKIIAALDQLSAGGSTAGGAGIKLAYKVAAQNLIEDGNNRVILATDGDFNVGESSTAAMVELIEKKRKQGIYLTITGFGMGNYKDGRMEQISNAGNGNYFYIDNIKEAEKVFVREMRATLFTIAKDVKIQVEFNPKVVQAYRLIGYENRMLEDEDFNNDKKDAGELGAGHTVTALYEIIPVGVKSEFIRDIDPLKYQSVTEQLGLSNDEILTVKFRYKKPDGDKSQLIVKTLENSQTNINETSENYRFSAAVAEFGMLLRDSEFKQNASYNQALQMAKGAMSNDEFGYRSELISMIRSCQMMAEK